MPQYTDNYQIPYPTDGDPIYLGASQMEALARKVDALLAGHSGIPDPTPEPEPDPAPAAVYTGALRWAGPQYNPPTNSFTRLRTSHDGRLAVAHNVGGVAASDNNNPRLMAPVDGYYLLSATQLWNNGNAIKGMGLGSSASDGAALMLLWSDVANTQFGHVTTMKYLRAGTVLYPWTWSGSSGTGMAPDLRGIQSEYSLTLLSLA